MGIAVGGVDLLSEKAAMMRECLQKSETITDNVVTILGSFDHRLSALETAMRPTQVPFFFLPIKWARFWERVCFFWLQNGVLGNELTFLWLGCNGDLFWRGLFVFELGIWRVVKSWIFFIWVCRLELTLLGRLMRILIGLWRLRRLYWLTSINIVRLVLFWCYRDPFLIMCLIFYYLN